MEHSSPAVVVTATDNVEDPEIPSTSKLTEKEGEIKKEHEEEKNEKVYKNEEESDIQTDKLTDDKNINENNEIGDALMAAELDAVLFSL